MPEATLFSSPTRSSMHRLLCLLALSLTAAGLSPAPQAQYRPAERDARAATAEDPVRAAAEALLESQRARRARLLAELGREPRRRRSAQAAPPTGRRGGATVFTVDNAYDDADTDPGDGSCSTFFLDCTLRAALQEANATPGSAPVQIEFAITFGPQESFDAATGVWTVFPSLVSGGSLGPFPTVTRPNVTVDGLTQGGASCGALTAAVPHDLRVALDGSLLTTAADGLTASGDAAGVVFRGLLVRRFPGYGLIGGGPGSLLDCLNVGAEVDTVAVAPNAAGVLLPPTGLPPAGATLQNSLVSGNLAVGVTLAQDGAEARDNLIGTDEGGTLPFSNGGDGVLVTGDDVVLDGNVVSANGGNGVALGASGGLVAERATVMANLVGLSGTGADLGLGNAGAGVAVLGGASGHRIGGGGAGNAIAANVGAGVRLAGPGNAVLGNTIGLAAGGVAAPNAVGVEVTAAGNAVGGAGSGAGNVISGNGGDGVVVAASDTEVTGNVIGLTADGDVRPNVTGIVVGAVSGVVVAENTVSANRTGGVRAGPGCDDLVVSGNQIGTGSRGLAARGNRGVGLDVTGCGDLTVEGNVVAGNEGTGIAVTAGPGGDLVVIRGNTVGLGADGSTALGNDGVGISVSAGGPAGPAVRIGEPGAGNLVSANGGRGSS